MLLTVFIFHCPQVIKQDLPLCLPSPLCIYSVQQHKWHIVTPTNLFWGWVTQTAFVFWLILKGILGEKEKFNPGSAGRMDICQYRRAAPAVWSSLSYQVLILGAMLGETGDRLTPMPVLQPLLILIRHQIHSHPVNGREAVVLQSSAWASCLATAINALTQHSS